VVKTLTLSFDSRETHEEESKYTTHNKRVTEKIALSEYLTCPLRRHPYFLQEWGYEAWNHSEKSPITGEDVNMVNPRVIAKLDDNFFRVRFDRLTPSEKRYLRAMAELGPGPHRSGDITNILKVKVQSGGPVRSGLIQKGMIYSPAHGDTAFTVPLFDEFMRRVIPEGFA
jgi:hypothetical protein